MDKWTQIRETETAYWFRNEEGETMSVPKEDDLTEIVEYAKQVARERGWMVGDINQTDKWFRD